MDAAVIVVSNNSVSSMGYSAGLFGYGYRVETIRSFEAARLLLNRGLQPASIIIDVKYSPAEINLFIDTLRHEVGYTGVILVVGQAGHHGQIIGASQYLPRPADLAQVVSGLRAF